DGYLILALYNHHWTSPLWKIVKLIYNCSPKWLQALIVGLFAAPLFLSLKLFIGKSSTETGRGMSFYHDLVDWIGGYPYEYVKRQDLEKLLHDNGFRVLRCIMPRVPTGNWQWICKRDLGRHSCS
ncbi:MAG: hypothetical protein KDD42_07090, partial [Bdellovibrionales bacterium]|nr:hypothetical protein [Bdellovibrionales bacterium]